MLLLKVITQLHAWTDCRKCLKIFVLLHAQSNMNTYLFLKWLILTVNIYQNFSGTKYSTCSFMWCRSWCSAIPDVLFSKSKRDHVFLFHRPILCSSVINETGNANPLTSDYIPSYSNTRITSQGEWRASLFTYIFWWAFPYRQLKQWVTKLVRLLNLMHKDIWMIISVNKNCFL